MTPMPRYFSGQRLRTRRTAAGLTPERLALAVGRSVYSIHEYERGRALPSVNVLARLASALDCSIDDLFQGAEVIAERWATAPAGAPVQAGRDRPE